MGLNWEDLKEDAHGVLCNFWRQPVVAVAVIRGVFGTRLCLMLKGDHVWRPVCATSDAHALCTLCGAGPVHPVQCLW